MALDKNDLKKIETELAVLKERFSRASERIGKTGGKKNKLTMEDLIAFQGLKE